MASNGKYTIGFRIEAGDSGLKTLVVDAKALRKALETNVKAAKALDDKFANLATSSASFANIRNSISQISGVLDSLTQESRDFGGAMKAANTMAGKGAKEFQSLRDQVSELSKTVPLAREALADGLYQVISNGVPEDNWIEFLTKSARSAVGGIADLNQVVGVTSTVIKNYGLEWSAAQEIQDKIQLTAKNGVTSFEQLAAALPRVTGNAATLGVSIDELMATFATLTGVSGNTAEVSTQLAAIFTALVKPSSEAARMAGEMGIQFDAAAIKAAGGFEAFLQSLDKSVKAYSEASGILEQEVYGKLFGSAESLRALVPLQGELAGKFSSNVSEMRKSAGTMDEAFLEMSSTGSAVTRMLENQMARWKDMIASVVSSFQPYLNLTATLGMSAMSVSTLGKAMKELISLTTLQTLGTKLLAASEIMLGRVLRIARADFVALAMASDAATKALIGTKIAVKGLLAATGVGLVFMAITTAIEHFITAADDAADASGRLADAQKRAQRAAEMAQEVTEAEADARKSAVSSIELHIAKLKDFKGSKTEEKKLIGELNTKYGDTMGYFSSISDWYKALVANSEAYCRQMIIEAKTRKLADQIAELEVDRDKIAKDEYGNTRKYSSKRETQSKYVTDAFGNSHYVGEEVIPGTSDVEKAQAAVDDYTRKINALKGSLRGAAQEAAKIKMPVTGAAVASGDVDKSGGKGIPVKPEDIIPAGSIAEIEKRISDIDKKVKYSIDPDEIYTLEREKVTLQKRLGVLEIPIRIASTKEKWEKMTGEIEPIEIPVKVDVTGLTDEIRNIDLGESSAEKLQKTLGTISGMAGQAGTAFRQMGEAFEIPALDVMGVIAGAIATMIQGYASASAQSSGMGPFGWLAFSLTGLSALATMVSQVKGLTAFADGGVVYGPTAALVGEYSGARNNPEVIAPLNKLKDIIGEPSATPVIVGGRIEADGRTLAVVLENYSRISGKSGKRNRF